MAGGRKGYSLKGRTKSMHVWIGVAQEAKGSIADRNMISRFWTLIFKYMKLCGARHTHILREI